ncbi:MAG TPA: Scr1 family TA system antitoxin-like transcriptional regulator [Pseudonocardiaceae bacterium]
MRTYAPVQLPDQRRRQLTYSEVLPHEFEGFLGLESEAARILSYEADVVPGLLQTHDYRSGRHRTAACPACRSSGCC